MDAMNLAAKIKTDFAPLLARLKADLPEIAFQSDNAFRWSAEDQTVYYSAEAEYAAWTLLHEVGHMIRKHADYRNDATLIRMEVEAWATAKELAVRYGLSIDEEYIQDCIDSYRNWQYQRSKCPICTQTGIEKSDGQYKCINCRHEWDVSTNRFCRVYRKSNR